MAKTPKAVPTVEAQALLDLITARRDSFATLADEAGDNEARRVWAQGKAECLDELLDELLTR